MRMTQGLFAFLMQRGRHFPRPQQRHTGTAKEDADGVNVIKPNSTSIKTLKIDSHFVALKMRRLNSKYPIKPSSSAASGTRPFEIKVGRLGSNPGRSR